MKNAQTTWRFRRNSVADQAAAALREAIHRRELGNPLPGEHELARQLRISRPSVRAALAQLAAAGLIAVQTGRRARILNPRRRSAGRPQPTVCLVCPLSRHARYTEEHPILLEMHAQLASQGIGWEEVFDAKLAGPRPERRLQQLVGGRGNVCWIMSGATPPIQHWFANSSVLALVLGSCQPRVRLPSVDFNYHAVGWHAAGAMTRHGHNQLAVVLPSCPLPGDLACRDGFREYLVRRTPHATVTELGMPENLETFGRKIDRLLADPAPPTAWLSMHPSCTLALFTYLLTAGIRIPQDASFIARDTHPLLDSGLPKITRYSSALKTVATRAVQIAARLLAGESVSNVPVQVMPRFIAGNTLAPPTHHVRGNVQPIVPPEIS